MPKAEADHQILRMALIGYEAEREKIDEKMSEIRALLGGRSTTAAIEESAPVRKRRRMSKEARARIGAATRARWAAMRKEKSTTTKKSYIEEASKVVGGGTDQLGSCNRSLHIAFIDDCADVYSVVRQIPFGDYRRMMSWSQ
jgi:hypothetical protein